MRSNARVAVSHVALPFSGYGAKHVRRLIEAVDPYRETAEHRVFAAGHEAGRLSRSGAAEAMRLERPREVPTCMNDPFAFLPPFALLVQVVACRVLDELGVDELIFVGELGDVLHLRFS